MRAGMAPEQWLRAYMLRQEPGVRETTGLAWAFEISKAIIPSDTPSPVRPHFLTLSKQFHSNMNLWGPSSFKPSPLWCLQMNCCKR